MAYLDQVEIGGVTYGLTDTKGRAMIAPKEESSTASAAHAAGSYFTLNDLLYQATADIAVGGTITPNTNCKAVTVGAETSELKSALKNNKYLLTEPKFIEMQHLQINNSGVLAANESYDAYTFFLNGLTQFRGTGFSVYGFFGSAPTAGDTSVDGARYTSIPDSGIITVPTGGLYVLCRVNAGANAPTLFNVNEDEMVSNVVKSLSDSMDEVIDASGIIKNPAAITSGVYVEQDGDIQSNSSFSTTEPFLCGAGDYIYIKGTGYNTAVSMVSKTNEGFSSAEPLVISIDSTEREYTYKVASPGYYCCSFDNRKSYQIILYKNYSNYALVRANNPFYGKSISSTGDSIAYGAGYTDGYGGIIAARNGMTFNNFAHSGWAMATGITGGGDGICTIVSTMTSADFIFIEGGVNDYDLNTPLGAITSNGSATLDTSTFYGAVEYAIRQALATFLSSHIIYVITHVRKTAYFTPNDIGLTENDYWDAVRNVCHKYGIMIADVNRHSGLNTEKNAYRVEYTDNGDGTHPNLLGYTRYYVPVIEMAMKTLNN